MMGRCFQAPELAYAALCNQEEDILDVVLHPLQDQLSRLTLRSTLDKEVMIVVNRLGVDINAAVGYSHVVG